MAAQGQASRSRAVVILVFVAVVVVALAIGLVYLVTGGDSRSTAPGATATPASSPTSAGVDNASAEDELANRPMLTLPISAAQPQPVVSDVAGPPIEVPASTSKIVPGGPPVPTGFPHTPEGALGQLAAIDEAALSTTDLGRVHEVYAWSALSGAVDEDQWSPHYAIATLIDRLGGTAKAMQAHATFQVVEGQIKGTVGPNFVVACVLGEMDVTAVSSARAGIGDCQRMVWHEGRWRIGSGSQPAYAPSAWPGSADAVRAGWRELERAS